MNLSEAIARKESEQFMDVRVIGEQMINIYR